MAFGSFDLICSKTALPLCSVVASAKQDDFFSKGILPVCYARSVELANTMIFQIGNAFVHIGGLIVALVVVFNVRAKYTAIGRTEMLLFTYLMIGVIVSSLIVDCGVCPPSSTSYAYFVAVQIGLSSAACITLLYNGILCFQFWEDGTRRSMWTVRLLAFAWFVANFLIAIITFKSWNTALNHKKTEALFVVTYVLNAVIVAAYVVSQVILIVFALKTYWGLGAIGLGVFFFVAGQILTYVFSNQICNGAKHYIDGLFFGSLCNVFTFMMIYKFWDMITTDDLEFSVANVEQGIKAFGHDDEKRASGFF
ncbi:chitin synthase export chaperone [Suhomyces tanzawaensis NRRL Y-17324]|uniref:Chitin synthase export chaperone n=1 Tax=Suhomyces tanzawaensis NRRL Y-17324 TaxID=984487 RepID=A0A1E4SPE6_9ASCO|nr:chitin synthase export chaperone [Suhomyces tanzawaensis NRRL Y-17324]ODV81375.1 chitin synthase export chaperone [Suhomyces tanzawaensis NRRL Y-17324]